MAELTVGVDPVKLQIPVPGWQRIRQRFARKQPADYVHAFPMSARIDIPADDEGAVECQVLLVNHLARSVFPESVDVQSWTWSTCALPELPFTTRGLGVEMRKHSHAYLWLNCQLNAAAIKRFRAASPTSAEKLLSGYLQLALQFSMRFRGANVPAYYSTVYRPAYARMHWLIQGAA